VEALTLLGVVIVGALIWFGLRALIEYCERKYRYSPLNKNACTAALAAAICIMAGFYTLGGSADGEIESASTIALNSIVFWSVALCIQVGLAWHLAQKTNIPLGIFISVLMLVGALIFIIVMFFVWLAKEANKASRKKMRRR